MNMPHIGAQINPGGMQYRKIMIGDEVPITLSAWHWIELISELHIKYEGHPSVLLQYLAGKVFESLTPEDYRKAMTAELAEVQERMMANHPLGGLLGMQPPISADDITDYEDDSNGESSD